MYLCTSVLINTCNAHILYVLVRILFTLMIYHARAQVVEMIKSGSSVIPSQREVLAAHRHKFTGGTRGVRVPLHSALPSPLMQAHSVLCFGLSGCSMMSTAHKKNAIVCAWCIRIARKIEVALKPILLRLLIGLPPTCLSLAVLENFNSLQNQ